jgi:uncharacterized spore protein YtfJ
MDDVEKLLKGSVEELDRLLNAKNVLGEPIEREGATVIPIVSYGFGFGAGGNVAQKSGNSSGTGAGGGIKPLGAIIFDKDGARVESVKGTLTSMTEIISETASAAFDKMSKQKAKSES